MKTAVDPQRWHRVKELFEAAVERGPEERSAFLERACAGDESLRSRVESLIDSYEQDKSFMETPAVASAADSLLDDQTASLIGQSVGPYTIVREIGRGGMGEVYLAQDSRLGRRVALKLLPDVFTRDQDRLRRFEQEARTASALNHPNILTIHEIGQLDSRQFIAAEFIEGETLRQHLDTSEVSLNEALDIAIQVAGGLTAAHQSGIVHRDIKPENIMLRADGYVKVLDFGLAKLTERPATSPEASTQALVKTTPGMVMGTVQYMSPEQSQGSSPVDHRTDIWSLGVVLYEMVTGRVPFEGKDIHRQIIAIQEQEPPPLSKFVRGVPDRLEEIVSRALAKEPAERYQMAKDLLTDLRSLKHRIDIDAEIERVAPAESKVSTAGLKTDGGQGISTAAVETARETSSAEYIAGAISRHKRGFAAGLAIFLLTAIGLGFLISSNRLANNSQIESIAVLPFVNASGNADVEYLSDGMTELLINSLSQLPKLSVKARSSVFRYKGKDVEPQQVGSELSVQAILSGRVVQRGEDLTLYLSLVDSRNGNQLWGEQYNRKLTNLITLQSEIARDVSQKLRARLSGVDELKLTKNYTANAEAYQLYLKGRYHVAKLTPAEMQTGISYYRQAIETDPSYAFAYVGLADAYRSVAIAGEMPSTEFFPKAKDAAQKAIEIDDTLAEAHAELGFIIFWYDWDWNAAENQFKRALELNPSSADTPWFYAHLLSTLGRHSEALAEMRRARELDPLSLRINANEGQFLIHAGQPDEGLARLQKAFELDPRFWLAHLFASSAYIEKGMFAEAVAEARKARDFSGASTHHPVAFLSYALAKSGKQAEARAELEGLLKLSTERYVSSYNIALIYNGLDERDETINWLERGYKERDPKMVFLKVEPKWNNLRDDPRFQDLLRRIGLAS
ncbi:MAG TPA: protein kinase [Blastocatellia bacterium]